MYFPEYNFFLKMINILMKTSFFLDSYGSIKNIDNAKPKNQIFFFKNSNTAIVFRVITIYYDRPKFEERSLGIHALVQVCV